MTTRWQAVKDPDEVKDYGLIWTDFLDGDPIVSSAWIMPDGLGKNSDSYTSDITTIWLPAGPEGGVDGETYRLVNRITTAGGRTYDETAVLRCKNK